MQLWTSWLEALQFALEFFINTGCKCGRGHCDADRCVASGATAGVLGLGIPWQHSSAKGQKAPA